MGCPAGSLQIAEPCRRVGQRQLARRPLLREHRFAVVEVPDLDADAAVADLRVDRGVILPHAPQAFGEFWAWSIHATYVTHPTHLTPLLAL